MVNENCPKKFVVSSGVCLLQVHQAGCRSSILPSKALPFADLLIKPTNHEQGIITAEPAAESKALWGRIQTRITVCCYRYGPRLWGSPTTKQHPSIYPCSFCFHKGTCNPGPSKPLACQQSVDQSSWTSVSSASNAFKTTGGTPSPPPAPDRRPRTALSIS